MYEKDMDGGGEINFSLRHTNTIIPRGVIAIIGALLEPKR